MSRFTNKNKPTISAEMPEKYKKLRIALIILCLAVGVTLIATSVADYLTVDPGWARIRATGKENSGTDFVFQYYLGGTGKAPNLEQKAITKLYSQLCQESYRIFHSEALFEDIHNVAYLNAHPNKTVEVPEALYRAFALLENAGNRALYLAPLYQRYMGLFMSEGDWVAETYDPTKNQAAADFCNQVLTFTRDENAVKLSLLGNNQVKLTVSEAYLQFAEVEEITAFLDFYWMKNAFVADYLAEGLLAAGYKKGSLTSFDGFVRNLDSSDESYRLNIFDRVGEDVYTAAALEYKNVGAFVTLRNYPTSALAVDRYYKWADGTFTSCHIDTATGLSKSAINDLLGYSGTLSCGEILVRMMPIYMADSFNPEILGEMQGVETVYCKNAVIYASDSNASLVNLFKNDKVTYKKN